MIGNSQLQKFTMRGTQLLSSGRTTECLVRSGGLGLHAKVYAEGGENSLHAHDGEDHAFFVLAGTATFTAEDGAEIALNAFEGIVVPKGVYYKFQSSGEENLVLLRMSSASDNPDARNLTDALDRHSIDGKPIKNAGEPVPAIGKFFPA
jgi:mannose-6-phosphate isomerase-like protein (cupin superfamily)